MAAFRILCIDGGGLRGIYATTLLRRIVEQVPGFVDKVHMLGGTSTGSIISLGLAYGFTPEEGIELYKECGGKAFKDSFWDDVKDLFTLVGAQYSTEGLKELLEDNFQDTNLEYLFAEKGKLVLVPAFDLDGMYHGVRTWKSKFFHNFPGEGTDGAEKISDVILRSTAAPTYFPTYQGYVDGGVAANNPSMASIAQVLSHPFTQVELSEIRLLSLGTGLVPHYIPGENLDWGYAQWAKELVSMFMGGSMGIADYQSKALLRDNYFRLSPPLPEMVAVDAVDKMDDMIQYAEAVDLQDVLKWVNEVFMPE